VRFRYRLDGYSQNWSDVGTRRGASFVNLRPGRYRLLVSARHVGGAWSEPATLALVLQPFVYQRASFQIVLAMLAAVLGGVVGQWYIGRLRRRAAALERAVAQRTAELSVAHDHLSTAHDRLSATNDDLVDAKRQVEQAHGRLLAVFDQLDIGVLVLSATGVVRYASALAQRVLRKDDSALLGHTWSACLPLVDSDRAQVRRRVERQAGVQGRVPVQMLVGGTRYWLEIDVRDEPAPGDGLILYMYNVAEVSAQPESDRGTYGLVGRSTAIRVVRDQIRDVARVDSTVLIQGETGTGKELVARAIHRESRRANRPFVALNAAGLSESLLASQLFGHRRGAFTGAADDQMGVFEAAHGGTRFLDEVGDMPPGVQVSLLRVLQEREIVRLGDSQPRLVDVRFLAATHRDLTHEVAEGRFREDLLYRIRVATLTVPPLRERIDDVPLLVNTFLMQAAGSDGQRPPQVSRPAMDALMRYHWPGNVRELKSLVERALVHTKDVIHLDDLPHEVVTDRGTPFGVDRLPAGASERERLIAALRQSGGNRKEAARLLGIGRTTLYRRLVEYGIEKEETS
jgi:sigma-54 dependent transcriptional regulator, acetoin dehydrogenase operon transcriptional activator AcoR